VISTTRYFLLVAVFGTVIANATPAARAQSAPAPTPAATASPMDASHETAMDRAYDGKWHATIAPYLWAPTMKANVQFTVPAVPFPSVAGGPAALHGSIKVTPGDFLSTVNSGALLDIDARQGNVEVFGDYIYVNSTSNSSKSALVTLPGHAPVPVTVATSARSAVSIWELAAGFSLAHGHNADLNLFSGWRQFPVNVNLGYNVTIGSKGLPQFYGTYVTRQLAGDVIFGLRGTAYFGDGRWFVPYYADMGVGANNQSWQGYTGAGYAFKHGQTILLAYRTLNYNDFPYNADIQKFTMNGPLLGYTFKF